MHAQTKLCKNMSQNNEQHQERCQACENKSNQLTPWDEPLQETTQRCEDTSHYNKLDMWNAIAQGMNTSEEHILKSKDSFSEVDYVNGHLKKMLSDTLLNGFRKNGVPNHELTLKVGDVCLVTRAIHGLGLANNSRIRIIAIHRYCVEVVTIGECREQNVRIPHILFKFRLPYGKSYQLTRLQFPLHLVYAMTYNKSQP